MSGRGQPPSFDRDLVDLIASVTDEGQVMPLASALERYGPQLAARVVADHFAVIRRMTDGVPAGLNDDAYLPSEAAVAAIGNPVEAHGFVIVAGPWGPIALEDEPTLVFAYCADEPDAVREVQHRNAGRRESWEKGIHHSGDEHRAG